MIFCLAWTVSAIGGLQLANGVTELTKWPLVLPALLTVLSQAVSVKVHGREERILFTQANK